MSASRKVVVLRRLVRRTQRISGAPHRVEERLIEILVDLAAQAAHVHVDRVRLRVEMVLPDVLQEHRSCDDVAGVAHQELQQPELSWLKVDARAGPCAGAGEQIQFEIRHPQPGLDLAWAPTANERLDARQQLAEGVRLGEIVVTAGLQSAYAVVDIAESAQEQDRGAVPCLPQALDERQAVE